MNFLSSLQGAAGGAEAALFANLSAAAAAASVGSPQPFAENLSFQDKRNRNPNWTDHEIVRFLEMLQEDETVKDLVANRNKKVFCLIAQRMCAEGAEKTWDQCRIKLKNLKSQYRYVKERIPAIDDLDLENDDVVRQLISECQGRGISPSSIKHLRFLLRFLNKQRDFGKIAEGGAGTMGGAVNRFGNRSIDVPGRYHPEAMMKDSPLAKEIFAKSVLASKGPSLAANATSMAAAAQSLLVKKAAASEEEAVSPPTSPFPGLKLVNDASLKSNPAASVGVDPLAMGAGGGGAGPNALTAGLALNGIKGGNGVVSEQGYKFLEAFNREMMDQFMEHQRRTQASFTRWEQERWRQERESMERWRQEARDHERQLFGMFCTAMSKCNAAITAVLKAKTPATATNGSTNNSGTASKRKAGETSGPSSPKAAKKTSKDGNESDIGDGIEEVEDVDEDEDDQDDEEEEEANALQNEIQNMVQVNMDEGDEALDDDEDNDDDDDENSKETE